MRGRRTTWADLECIVVEGDAKPDFALVLCHGFGAPGTDLIDLAPALANCEPSLAEIAYVFPAAPLSLADEGLAGGRAWWPIDMVELMEAIQFGRVRDLRQMCPPELPALRKRIVSLIAATEAEWQLPAGRVAIGGFSQGAMLTTAVGLQEEVSLAGVAALSGTLLCEPEWRAAAPRKQGLHVFQSHGTYDPILPFANAEALRDLLVATEQQVEFHSFAGQHEIPRAILERLAAWLMNRRGTAIV